MCIYGPIQYGDLVIDQYTKSQANIESIQADDGVTIKHYKATIIIEFILTAKPGVQDPNGVVSADMYFENAATVLSTRGLALKVQYIGFGFIPFDDTTFGPHPRIIDWEPLGGNQAVRVKWRVEVFYAYECNFTIVPDDTTTPNRFMILQLVEELDMDFDDEGAVIFRINGTLEIASSGTVPITKNDLWEFFQHFGYKKEPTVFTRTMKVTLLKDHRTVKYTITDTEIKSDNPYFPHIITQDVEHEISSNQFGTDALSGIGFRTWVNEMSGTFTVAPGRWKGWAWVAFCTYLANRQRRAGPVEGDPDKFAKDEENLNGNFTDPKKKLYGKQIPLHLSIKERLNGRQVSISMRWISFCTLAQLFRSTGMFYPVNVHWQGVPFDPVPGDTQLLTPQTNENQWLIWKAHISQFQGKDGYRGIRPPDFDMIFDTCDSQVDASNSHRDAYYSSSRIPTPFTPSENEVNDAETTGKPLGTPTRLGTSLNPLQDESYYMRGLLPAESWVDYRNKFRIIETSQAIHVPTLANSPLSIRAATAAHKALSQRDEISLRINGNAEPPAGYSPYTSDMVQVRGKPTYNIRMMGHAIRLGWPIPTPVLVGVKANGGSAPLIQAYRIGTNQWEHDILCVSDEIPIYSAKWDLNYALLGDPSSSNIVFDTSGRPSEFA